MGIEDLFIEIKKFQQEFGGFKVEMITFKNEMSTFKTEMISFIDEMTRFKDEMLEFKTEMAGLKNEMIDFREETREELNRHSSILVNIENTLIYYGDMYKINKDAIQALDRRVSVLES